MRVDLHADTPLLMHWAGYNFCQHHRPWLPAAAWVSHVDLPRMAKGRLDVQLFGLVALPIEGDPFGTINGMIDRLEVDAQRSEGRFQLARSWAEGAAAITTGARVGLLSIEGVHPLRGKLSRAQALLDRGVISFGLCHFHANEACRPAKGLGRDDRQGLSAFGRELVTYLGEQGAAVDLTHINRKGFDEAVAHARGPVLVSHTGVNGAHPHWRNLDDEQIRAVADSGGVIGIIFARNFLGGSDVSAVVRHLQHLIRIGGDQVASLGSDFDGFVVPPRGLGDVSRLDVLANALEDAGLPAKTVEGIMGDNAARFLQGLGSTLAKPVETR